MIWRTDPNNAAQGIYHNGRTPDFRALEADDRIRPQWDANDWTPGDWTYDESTLQLRLTWDGSVIWTWDGAEGSVPIKRCSKCERFLVVPYLAREEPELCEDCAPLG